MIFALERAREEHAGLLGQWLYDHCYTVSIVPGAAAVAQGDEDLTDQLSAANQSQTAWVEGWRVEEILSDGRVIARRDGKLRSFVAGEYVSSQGPGCGPRKGASQLVYHLRESLTLQKTYYYAFGDAVNPFDEQRGMLRFYWNVEAPGAPLLMRFLTGQLNRFQVPFRFKCPKNASEYARRDAAVLYVHAMYYPTVAVLVERIYSETASHLRDDVPLFTRQLAPGLAFAEDPGQSFGKHRCELLAEVLLATPEPAARKQALERQFAERGISLERSWLNAGSLGEYRYPFVH